VIWAVAHENPDDERIHELLDSARTIAMVGASSRPERPSHGIFQKLLAHGYRVIPVNPNETEVLGQKAYASLKDVPEQIDIVDVFRRPEHTPAIAEDAVAIGAKTLWLQSGISNETAAELATRGGLSVVMDSCIGVMVSLLGIPKRA
jgi:predicted CoA-binding protein